MAAGQIVHKTANLKSACKTVANQIAVSKAPKSRTNAEEKSQAVSNSAIIKEASLRQVGAVSIRANREQ